ncbi:MAG: cyclase [Rhizobium sp.]|nr:cyclase [Rhizobium sp.]
MERRNGENRPAESSRPPAGMSLCRSYPLLRCSIPYCIAFEAEQRTIPYHYDEGVGTRGSGFLSHEYRHVGQWGTHVDPPAHFVRGKHLLAYRSATDVLALMAAVVAAIDKPVFVAGSIDGAERVARVHAAGAAGFIAASTVSCQRRRPLLPTNSPLS